MADDKLYTFQEFLRESIRNLYLLGIAEFDSDELAGQMEKHLAEIDSDPFFSPRDRDAERTASEMHTWAEWQKLVPFHKIT